MMQGNGAAAKPVMMIPQQQQQRRRRRQHQRSSSALPVVLVLVMVGIVLLAGELYALLVLQSKKATTKGMIGCATTTTTTTTDKSKNDASSYTCPALPTSEDQPDTAENFDPIRFANHYLTEDAHTQELQNLVQHFRDTAYDDWGQTYTHMKEGMTAWKQRTMVPNIQAGDAIYESAIGLGFNALMTVEILLDALGPDLPLTLYGNEYLVTSTARANEFLDVVLPPHVTKGNICVGDSTNISYVPSNAFDLVYTGYIL